MTRRIPTAGNYKVIEKLPRGMAPQAEPPDVTVVTVVFNAVKGGRRERFVQCLDSVQAQRGCRVEHLIVDGGSRDGTVDIVSGYENAFVPIRWLSHADKGIYDAMNRGIALARGKYVVFLNSDDRFVNPNGMCASLAALESHRADYSYAPLDFVGESGKPVDRCFPTADEMLTLFSGMTICHQTIVMRRDVLLAVDGFDLAYRSGADYDLLMRVIYAGCRGVRVEERFVEFQGGGFSAVNEDLSESETDRLFQSRLREAFGMDLPEPAIRCMRQNLEWPPALAERIRQVGERSFGCTLPPTAFERSGWEKCVRWRFVRDLAAALLGIYGRPSASRLGTIRQCLVFSCHHPIHALGAVKAWIVHRSDRIAHPLSKWFEIRCAMMAERLAAANQVVYPCDSELGTDAGRRSLRGLICTGSVRLASPPAGSNRPRRLLVSLSSSAMQEGRSAVEVLVNGRALGCVSLEPYVHERWGVFRLPKTVSREESFQIDLKMAGDGRFVFGGLCLA